MARNYMLDFMQGYGFVDNLERQKRLDAERADDRAFNRKVAEEGLTLQRQQGERAQKNFEMQKTEHDQAVADRNNTRDAYVKLTEAMFGQEAAANPEAVQKIGGLASDPQRTGEAMAMWDNIQRYLESEKKPTSADVSRFMTLAGKEELAARGGDDGLQRAVRAVVPSPDGKGLMFDFSVTGKDGKQYTAPMTKQAKTAGQGDDEVDSRDMAAVMGWGVGAVDTMRKIAVQLAKAGDNSIIEAYQAAKQKLAERVANREDKVWEKELDQKYATPEWGTVGDAKTGIFSFDKRTGKRGERLVGPAAGENDGKSELVTLKTGKVVTLDDARKSYLATYDKPDGMGGFDIGPGAPPFPEWLNNQAAEPFFSVETKDDPQALQQAEQQAEQWVNKQAGYLSSDAADFKDYGGDRARAMQAKTAEFYQQLTGQTLPGGGAAPSPPPQPTGGQEGAGVRQGKPGTQPPRAEDFLHVLPSGGKKPSAKPAAPPARQPGRNPASAGISNTAPSPADQAIAEIEQEKKTGRGKIVDPSLAAAAKDVGEAFANLPKDALDVYMAFIGQPVADLANAVISAQDRQRSLYLLRQRYKNGAISRDEFAAKYNALAK